MENIDGCLVFSMAEAAKAIGCEITTFRGYFERGLFTREEPEMLRRGQSGLPAKLSYHGVFRYGVAVTLIRCGFEGSEAYHIGVVKLRRAGQGMMPPSKSFLHCSPFCPEIALTNQQRSSHMLINADAMVTVDLNRIRQRVSDFIISDF
jgi:hypothetical protein